MNTPRSKENGTIVASVRRKTPKTGKVPNIILKLTPTQITMGIIVPNMKPIALISAVIIFLPGGFEKMNFLTTQQLNMLKVVQTIQKVKIMTVITISGLSIITFQNLNAQSTVLGSVQRPLTFSIYRGERREI